VDEIVLLCKRRIRFPFPLKFTLLCSAPLGLKEETMQAASSESKTDKKLGEVSRGFSHA